ncbi:MAG: M50 family metallopeptidase, partial [Candidatus Gracilibacteria bacterium]|nr:M50 family metallopeptidase [Candidatus Gracilibacteria bacterium]
VVLQVTAGGIRDLVLAGGYIGSAIFGNILIYIGFKKTTPNPSLKRKGDNTSQNIIYFLSGLMVFVAIFWFNSIFSSLILFALAGTLFSLAKYTKYDSLILQFLGISSIIYIIEDFSVGPSSDLSKFSEILPSSVWMIIWLIIVIAITVI